MAQDKQRPQRPTKESRLALAGGLRPLSGGTLARATRELAGLEERQAFVPRVGQDGLGGDIDGFRVFPRKTDCGCGLPPLIRPIPALGPRRAYGRKGRVVRRQFRPDLPPPGPRFHGTASASSASRNVWYVISYSSRWSCLADGRILLDLPYRGRFRLSTVPRSAHQRHYKEIARRRTGGGNQWAGWAATLARPPLRPSPALASAVGSVRGHGRYGR